MVTQNWMQDAILYVYALSLLFYFSDFMNESRRFERTGTGLLIFVWFLQTSYLLGRLMAHEQSAAFTPYEYWFAFSWLLITISLVISRFYKINFIIFFVNVVGFAVFALNLYSKPEIGRSLTVWEATRELLYVHISLVLCAYAALTVGAVFSGMYLFLHHRLKGKRWSSIVRRLPSLNTIDQFIAKTVIIGVPLLAMSLSIAVISLIVEGRLDLLLDLKVISSFAALISFFAYVYQKSTLKRPGLQLAKLYLVCFSLLLVNLVTNFFSSFH